MKKKTKKKQVKKTCSLKELATLITVFINLIIAVINLIMLILKIQ